VQFQSAILCNLEPVMTPFMMYRYNRDGDQCGDTWHQSLQDAFAQAAFEYGLRQEQFLRVE